MKSFEYWLKLTENLKHETDLGIKSYKDDDNDTVYQIPVNGEFSYEFVLHLDDEPKYKEFVLSIDPNSWIKTKNGFLYLTSDIQKRINGVNESVKSINEAKKGEEVLYTLNDLENLVVNKLKKVLNTNNINLDYNRNKTTRYEYGYEGNGFSGRTVDNYIVDLDNILDPMDFINESDKALINAIAPTFFNLDKINARRTSKAYSIFLSIDIAKAIRLNDTSSNSKYHLAGISFNIFANDSTVTGANGIWMNEIIEDASFTIEALKTQSKKAFKLEDKIISYFYFNGKVSSNQTHSNTTSTGLGSGARDYVTTKYDEVWDISDLLKIKSEPEILTLLKTNFHFNRVKNLAIKDNLLVGGTSHTDVYDSKIIDLKPFEFYIKENNTTEEVIEESHLVDEKLSDVIKDFISDKIKKIKK